jgi:A/G-specific adenine glycosylase
MTIPVLHETLAEETLKLFREKVFDYYHHNRRHFPWRETTDRYAVLVSEVMLQQTQAERVKGKFVAWMKRFPDLQSLASALQRDVLELWSGLGYNSRGLRLQACAKAIMEHYGGVVPTDPMELKYLPGIGEYTSRSIPAFADNLDVAAVDTNIRRIIIHEFAFPETISKAEIQEIAELLLPKGQSRQWHNALMDYGAQHLTSRKTGIRPLSRQSKFQGSKRWYRGRLLKDLLAVGHMSLEEVGEKYGSCPWGFEEIVAGLVREGFIEQAGDSQGTGGILRIRD